MSAAKGSNATTRRRSAIAARSRQRSYEPRLFSSSSACWYGFCRDGQAGLLRCCCSQRLRCGRRSSRARPHAVGRLSVTPGGGGSALTPPSPDRPRRSSSGPLRPCPWPTRGGGSTVHFFLYGLYPSALVDLPSLGEAQLQMRVVRRVQCGGPAGAGAPCSIRWPDARRDELLQLREHEPGLGGGAVERDVGGAEGVAAAGREVS